MNQVATAPIKEERAIEERVERIHALLWERYRKRILEHPMMRELTQGRLPMEVIRGFVKNFHAFVLGVNTAVRTLYKRELETFQHSPQLEDAFIVKATDEFCFPGPGGHIRPLEHFAAKVGVSREELVHCRLLPGALAYIDGVTSILAHSPNVPLAEIRAISLHEEPFGAFCKLWYDALTAHYGISPQDADYFYVHYKHDLSEHDGAMAHGEYNKMVLRRLLESDAFPKERKGWGIETCALLGVELFGLLIDDVYETYHPQKPSTPRHEDITISPIKKNRKKGLKAELGALLALVQGAWESILKEPFMLALRDGSLSRERLVLYFRSSHGCLVEEIAGFAGLYYWHHDWIKADHELEDWITMRIGEGLNKPRIGGGPRIIRQIGAHLGIREEEFFSSPTPEAVGYQGWLTKSYQYAPLTELMAFFLGGDMRKNLLHPVLADALVSHYGLREEEVADLRQKAYAAEPEVTLRFVKRVALGDHALFRPGWGLTYAATIQAGMHRLLLRGVMRHAS